MRSITEGLLGQLQGQPLNQMSQKLGLSPSQMTGALGAALPLLIGALGRNAQQPQGAQSLFGALQKDHADQDVDNVVNSSLQGGGQGGQILGHVFGQRQQMAAQGLGSATGLGEDKANMLLRWLAPVALAYIAKQMFDRRQDKAASTGDARTSAAGSATEPSPEVLGKVLQHEEREISQQGGVGGGLLSAVLDRNNDGKVDFSDLLGIGRQSPRVDGPRA